MKKTQSLSQLHSNLKQLGVTSLVTGKPIPFAAFKNRITIHRCGNKLKVVYMGQPEKNLFAFFTVPNNDTNTMIEAYDMFARLANGDLTEYNEGLVQWGNCKIPLGYEDLTTK